jgi:hypothetical protein
MPTIGTSPTLILTASGTTKVTVHGVAGNDWIYLGDSGVSTSDGYPVGFGSTAVPASVDLTLSDGTELYGVATTSRQTSFIATN